MWKKLKKLDVAWGPAICYSVLILGFMAFVLTMPLWVPSSKAQVVIKDTFQWPEPVGWVGYGSGVYSYEGDMELHPFEQALAGFIANHPQVRVVTVFAEGFSKKYENPQRTRRYVVLCERADK